MELNNSQLVRISHEIQKQGLILTGLRPSVLYSKKQKTSLLLAECFNLFNITNVLIFSNSMSFLPSKMNLYMAISSQLYTFKSELIKSMWHFSFTKETYSSHSDWCSSFQRFKEGSCISLLCQIKMSDLQVKEKIYFCS